MDDTAQHSANIEPLTIDDIRRRSSLTIEETAATFGISRTSAYQAAARGEIPTVRIGRRLIVPTSALLRLLDA